MIKKMRRLFLLFLLFFIVGLFLSFFVYNEIKREFVFSNSFVVGAILKKHPELEKDIILSLENYDGEDGYDILKKYGLTNLDSLDYLSQVKDLRFTYFLTFLIFYFSFVFCLFLYFYFTLRKQQEGIKKIDRYLFSLLSDEIQVDLKEFQNGELESLQNDLMKVTSRLKNALEHSSTSSLELSKTLADISLQLKTPITSMSIINDALASPSMDDLTRQEFLKRQEDVLRHMQTLVVNLLKVSQIESGMIELKKDSINVFSLIQSVLDELEVLLVAKNISVNFSLTDNIMILGDFVWLKEAVLNIVKNGVEHSYQDGVICIEVLENPMYVEILIKDFGTGIKKSDLPHIFERFYKSSKNSDSVGIGLNLSKSIFDRMNATVRVSSNVHEGTTFVIHFYKCVV